MSTFNGTDYFGSGPHRILVQGERFAKKRTAYAGVNGVESLIMGARGRPVTIQGQLRGGDIAALDVIIGNIEVACSIGPADLVNNFGLTYSNVELDSLTLTSHIMLSGSTYIVHYVCRGMDLY